MFLGILVLITALSISAVAIYYSVAGLVAIFAAAAVPIMIMGGALEIGKLVTAVWLHRYWHEAKWFLKTYLSIAVLVLMFITSMGIFGFLSRAHIEQTAEANQSVQEIQQIEDQILREQAVIERANLAIEGLRSQGSNRDQEIQEQIDLEQQRIDTAYERIEPALEEQRDIIEARQQLREQRISEVEAELEIARQGLTDLDTALAENDIRRAQAIVGTDADGSFGPGTERAIAAYRARNQAAIDPLQQRLETIRTEIDTHEQTARDEIARLRQFAEQQIQDSNNLIARLRAQIGTENIDTVQQQIQEQQEIINQANITVDSLIERKYALETEYRLLEAEVGPVKYLAEFIYGERADQDLLEEAVRWVILIIIFVFDPLAVLLLIASQATFEMHRIKKEADNGESLRLPAEDLTNDTDDVIDTPLATEEEKIDDYTDRSSDDRNDRQSESGGTESAVTDGDRTEIQSSGDADPETTEHDTDTRADDDGGVLPEGVLESQPEEKLDELDESKKKDIELLEESKREAEYNQKDSDPTIAMSKAQWKQDHPTETLKRYKTLYVNGVIDSLPWENYKTQDNYDVGYKQNEEQTEKSLFNKIQHKDSDEN